MDVREKLVELLHASPHLDVVKGYKGNDCTFGQGADWLITHGVTVQEWIPVTERLPDWRDGKVLVFTKYGFSVCERTVNNRWQGQHANWITHWMPMPEPPKEDAR